MRTSLLVVILRGTSTAVCPGRVPSRAGLPVEDLTRAGAKSCVRRESERQGTPAAGGQLFKRVPCNFRTRWGVQCADRAEDIFPLR